MTGTGDTDWRARLMALQAEIDAASRATRDDRATVTLDQQAVGRLSRMDALQQQAMAQAEEQRRQAMAARIKAALDRLDEGEFGYCVECGEEIAPARLELDPTLPLCIACARR